MISSEFGRYRILSRIGEGGMGEVYLAEDPSLARKVALKFILPARGGDEHARRRLVHEARAAAHLDHPFICKVYEAGEQDGTAYLALEYVEGVTLEARLAAAGKLTEADAIRIAAEVAEAVHFGHVRGIVHRDLKPSNVMIAADGHAKVMDFGVAKRVAALPGPDDLTAGGSMSASLPGEVTGSVPYMSPEQVRGQPVDSRSDIFSFGILLYELLTGRHPFRKPSVLETAHAIANEPAPSMAQQGATVNPLLEHIVNRCLEKDRERRYQALSDVRIELEGLAPVAAAGAARPRRRVVLALTSAAIVAAVGAVSWFGPLSFLAPEPALAFQERDWLVIADVNNLTADAVFNRSLRLALEVAIAQSQYVNVYPRERVAATLRRMKHAGDALDESAAIEVARRDQVRGVLACDIAQVGNTYSITARLVDPKNGVAVLTESARAASKDQVLDALDGLARHVRRSLGESIGRLSEQGRPLVNATTSSLEALQLYTRAVFPRGEADSRASDQLLAQAIVLDPDFALAHAEMGRRYYLLSRREDREAGERHYQRALALTDRLTLRERLWIEASAEDSRGNRERAVDAYKAYVAQYPDDTLALFRLAWTQMATLRQLEEAAANFKRVIAINPSDPSAHVNLATAYAGMKHYDDALAEYRKAFELDPSMMFGTFINNEYGFMLVEVGRLDEARPVFERMTTEGRENLRARGFRSLAFLDMCSGHYRAATGDIRRAITLNRANGERLSEYRDRLILTSALTSLGRTAEADAEWVHVRESMKALTLGPEWLWRPARVAARAGRRAEAAGILALMRKTNRVTATDSSTNRLLSRDDAFVSLVDAEIDLAEGRTSKAVDTLEQVHAQLRLPDSLESLAFALASARRVDDAIRMYEQLLADPPFGLEAQEGWFAAHVELGALYEKAGRTADARRLYTSLLERWKDGDADLRLLSAARTRLARLPAT